MNTPAAKRRRIDAASHVLSKPFRSPFKTPLADTTTPSGNLPTQKQDGDSIDTSSSKETILAISQTPTHSSPAVATPLRIRLIKNKFSSPIAMAGVDADPEIAALIKSQRQLETQLREMKEEMELTEQARKIEVDSEKTVPGAETDAELVELIQKWRGASRLAAEELFTSVRDRVNRMGGPKAWKEMEDRQREFRSGWDAEPLRPDQDDDNDQDIEKRDLYAEYDIDSETANEKEARGGNEIVDDEDADEFTMAMMLRSLNVPLSTIGYDRDQQRWAD